MYKYIYMREKGGYLTRSYDKSHYTYRKTKKQRDNTHTPPKTSITQGLWTDLGRPVKVTIATQLVLLNRFMECQPSHYPQKLCNQKDTHLKMCT